MTPNGNGNGNGRAQDGRVRVAIVGVGNCASSLVQGVALLPRRRGRRLRPRPDARQPRRLPRPRHRVRGRLRRRRRQGRQGPLARPSSRGQNNTINFADVPHTGVTVHRGMTHDGLGKYLGEIIEKAAGPDRRHRRDPQGVQGRRAGQLPARWAPSRPPSGTSSRRSPPACAFVNCIPVFIAREQYWSGRFEKAGLPIIGDDIKSQVGATIVHRQLARLFRRARRAARAHPPAQRRRQHRLPQHARARAPRVQEDLQDQRRHLASSTTRSAPDNVHIGPSDHVAWLKDRKWAYIRLEGRSFGDVPLNVELKLEVWDSPELRRHRDRRGALRQAGARQRHLRRARVPVGLPHEVAPGAAPRRVRAASRSRSSSASNARPGAPAPVEPTPVVNEIR